MKEFGRWLIVIGVVSFVVFILGVQVAPDYVNRLLGDIRVLYVIVVVTLLLLCLIGMGIYLAYKKPIERSTEQEVMSIARPLLVIGPFSLLSPGGLAFLSKYNDSEGLSFTVEYSQAGTHALIMLFLFIIAFIVTVVILWLIRRDELKYNQS